MNKLMIGAGVAALLAVPALALHGGGDHHGAKGPTTRAELLAKVQERFVKVDADKDGAITRAEFDAHRATMKAEHEARRAQRRAEHFAELDTDKSGQLSKEEFSAPRSEGEHRGHRGMHHGGWGKMHGMGMGTGRGEGWFDRLDANKDGRVTLAEAQAVPLAMFNKADANKDGTVTPEERKAAWEAMRGEWKAKGS